MYIKIVGLYGMENQKGYFGNVGDGCFDFVRDKKYASDLSNEEVEDIMKDKDWYLKNYGAEFMFVIK